MYGISYSIYMQTFALKNTQRFKFGFELAIFWVFCKSLANFEKNYLKLNKKRLFFEYGFGY